MADRSNLPNFFLKIIEICSHDLRISDLLSAQWAADASLLGKTNSARKRMSVSAKGFRPIRWVLSLCGREKSRSLEVKR